MEAKDASKEAETEEAELIRLERMKTPGEGVTPKRGVKEIEEGWETMEELLGYGDKGLERAKDKVNFNTTDSGGAEEVVVQPSAFKRAGEDLRERVKTTLSCNLVQELSLRGVGYTLYQCLLHCCKPKSTAEEPVTSKVSTGNLAYAVQDDPTRKTWENATVLALQHLAGLEASQMAGLRCEAAQKEGVRVQLERFNVWEEKLQVVDFKRYFETKTIDYSGDEVRTAQKLNWKAVSNSLPEGVGHLELKHFCTLGTRAYVENFEDFLVPEDLRSRVKPPRVMVEEGQWDDLTTGLVERNLCKIMPLEEVYHLHDEPLLNGLFAVGKSEWVDGLETQRLIMNLTPVNALCRALAGDIGTLPSLANFGLMMLGKDEACVVSSEDVRCFFYLFRTPEAWHRYMCFNKEVSAHLVPAHLKGKRCVLSATVLPMGFANSVSIAQHVHRNVIKWAANTMSPPLGGEGEIRKDRGFPSCPSRFRVYLDNFDQLEVVDKRMADHIRGTVSEQVLAIRQQYESLDLPRHPKKAVSRELRAEVQGALVLGDMGIAIPKPQKLMQYIRLTMELLVQGECTLRELQVVCGGLVYFTSFRRPLLCALNCVWRFMEDLKGYPPVIRLPLSEAVVTELVRFLCLIPLAQINFTAKLEGTVTCSDASLEGGGMCASKGLTAYGVSACSTDIRGDIPEPQEMIQVLSIGMFDGLGALRVACDTLGLPMSGHISIEQDPRARRVVEAAFPDTLFHDDVTTIDEEMVKGWALKHSNAGVVILGGGPPCQGVSGLNFDRRGALKDHRSKLFAEVPRVKALVEKEFFWAQVHLLMESVASMNIEDREIMSEAVELRPWKIDSLGLTICRRPRLYWCTWEFVEQEQAQVNSPDQNDGVGEVRFSSEVFPSKLLNPGWSLSGETLPTFTTARPSEVPGRKPAGIDSCSPEEIQRWKDDSHRFPPYQYTQRCGVVNKHGLWRLPDVGEREVCMGLPWGYTKMCMPKGQQKGWDYENTRLTLLGNSWQVGVITWLLGQLFTPLGLCPKYEPHDVVHALTPGLGGKLQTLLLRPPLGHQRHKPTDDPQGTLVGKLLGIASIKGEDLLLQAASEQTVKFHRLRASIPSTLWKWKEIAGWQWKGSAEHINCLEMRAVLSTLKWWTKKRKLRSSRILHLVDSLVVLHALSRGRTSSRKLRRTLMRINSLILSADLHPVWGYVHTSMNPADKPSRRVRFVKKKWVK